MPTAEQLFFAKYIHTMELSVNQIKQFTVNLSVLLLHLDFHIKGLHPILIAFKPLVWLTSWFLMRVQILHIYLLTDTNRINKLEAKNKNKKNHPLKKILCTFVTLISRNCKKRQEKKSEDLLIPWLVWLREKENEQHAMKYLHKDTLQPCRGLSRNLLQ